MRDSLREIMSRGDFVRSPVQSVVGESDAAIISAWSLQSRYEHRAPVASTAPRLIPPTYSLQWRHYVVSARRLGIASRNVKSSRPKFGLGVILSLGLGLRHLASAWPRSAAEEPAVKKRLTSLFADYSTSHNDRCRR